MEIIRPLSLYIAEKRHVPFAWGQHDCNTLIVEWHDRLMKSNWLNDVRGHYNCKLGAIRFYKTKLDCYTWFEHAGYVQAIRARSGDILIDGINAWLVLGSYAYTVQEGGALTRKPLREIDAEIWRKA